MMRESPKDPGEKLTMAILTLAMTAGLFAFLTLVFAFFLNPSASTSAVDQEKSYKEIVKLLQSQHAKDLRDKAKKSEKEASSKSLDEIVFENLRSHGIQYSTLPPPKRAKLKEGLERVDQDIPATKPASLTTLLRFIGQVKDAKTTIQVPSVNLTRDRSTASKDNDDAWTLTVKFVDYVDLSKKAAPAAEGAPAGAPSKGGEGAGSPATPGVAPTTPAVTPTTPAVTPTTPAVTPTTPAVTPTNPAPGSPTNPAPGSPTNPAPAATPGPGGAAPAAPPAE